MSDLREPAEATLGVGDRAPVYARASPDSRAPVDASTTRTAGENRAPAAAWEEPATSFSRPGTLPEAQVQRMFDRIARVYDPMNSLMTAGLHHRWRERAADLAGVRRGDRALDVATGTGDLALSLWRRVGPEGEVVGCDFSEGMLSEARRKVPKACFEWANAMDLPYDDDTFAATTVGFGARNFADLDRGFAEMVRVTSPGGRVVVLEITAPARPPLAWFYRVWFDRCVPALGWLVGDPDAYAYLPSSVRRFPGPSELAARLADAGLTDVRFLLTAGGIIALHTGTVSGR